MNQVKDYMYKDITSVNETTTLRRAIRIMRLHRIDAVAVVDKTGKYAGCISAQEVINASVPDYIKSIYNTSFMSRIDQITAHLTNMLDDPITHLINKKCPSLSPTDSMAYAADLLSRNKKTILPVVEEGIFLGWVSKIDILSVVSDKQKT
ncbi:MAG: CBS domain-containing protein [Bacteroidales bacterium]|nr:CBS domain-containing protein [Bacteroidales bacterium]